MGIPRPPIPAIIRITISNGTIPDGSPSPIFVQNRIDNVYKRRRRAAVLWKEMIVGPFGGRGWTHKRDGRVFTATPNPAPWLPRPWASFPRFREACMGL